MSIGAALLSAPAAKAATAVPQGGAYRVIDLGTLNGSDWSEAFAVNEHGHAAGQSDGHATLWRNGRIIDLGVLPGGLWSVATDLNDRDEVVGYGSASGGTHAFLWKNGRMRDLGALPGGTDSYAEGINNAGDVVGNSTAPGEYTRHAVRWRAGRLTDLDPEGQASFAKDITDHGWIVGHRFLPEDPMNARATAWRHDVPTTLIPDAPSYPAAANERHQVALNDSGGRASIWYRGGRTPLASEPALFAQVHDINDAGQVAGFVDIDAVVWRDGRAVPLPRLPAGGSAAAYGINDRGQLAGSSATTPDGTHQHAVLWTR
ncbi:hypothetical protein [Actinomadura monticuli]|uniref:HAF repeat-containing protein n=1 Tax=Actinomadura monticuli TaxID=3097367 RepID=A0ABV4QI90_9ACTN